jgi:hypothetical protein
MQISARMKPVKLLTSNILHRRDFMHACSVSGNFSPDRIYLYQNSRTAGLTPARGQNQYIVVYFAAAPG